MANSEVDARVETIAKGLQLLVRRLQQLGYEFARPEFVLPGPEPAVDSHIRQIELVIGTVPYALAAFWRRVGSVDLCGSHPDWLGCGYPDPLFVYPSSEAVNELDDFVADREERLRCNFPYVIPISPDDGHKANVSGGMWYNVCCPAASDDPLLNDERHRVTFLTYLELSLNCGGFLGLDGLTDHSWPLLQLTVDVNTIAS